MSVGVDILHATATFIVLALNRSTIWKLVRWNICARPKKYEPIPRTSYQDQDGDAPCDSPPVRSSLNGRALVIFASSTYIILAILKPWILSAESSSSPVQGLLAVINGICLLIHALSLSSEHDLTRQFQIGIRGAWGWLVTGITCLASIYEDLRNENISAIECIFIFSSMLIILAGVGGCLSLPQGHKIFRNSQQVDEQFTTSILGQITFSWATDVMYSVKRKGKSLFVEDIPEMGDHARAEALRESFKEARSKGMPLWKTLLHLHRGVFAWQMILTVTVCFLSIVPSLALFQILQLLETSAEGTRSGWLWTNVAMLATGVLLSSTLDTWKFWFSYNCLSLRTFEQLSIAIFEKSMSLPTACIFSDPDSPTQDTGDSMNLLAVDAKYVADCLCFSYVMYKAPLQLVISGTYLAHLLGWQSLVAGALVLALMTPVNIYAARKYSSTQQALMSARDRKTQVLTEVLQLIRQIKFSAQESRWEDIIGQSRQEELHALWTTFLWNISQLAVYLATPVILSVVCLGTHALVYKSLTAPAAFSAIAVLNSIEIVMYALPDCVARTATGLNSMKRIERHLDSRETNHRTESASTIELFNATLGWNNASPEQSVRPMLHKVTLCFPSSKLSLVTGPTGSGKSLLLASILGESTLLSGAIRGPKRGKYAYVAQVPWLANASIKENILFGNSLDIARYSEVIFACALQQDLALFPDRDSTEVGPSGVNLSGGQKWRLSLARALYSPADILIMDDIFSAVDVHTASHLFTHALTGPLATDRTRILVTHHVSLCLPQTEYIVSLENGSVQYAGPVQGHYTRADEGAEQTDAASLSLNDPVPVAPQMLVDEVNAQQPNSSPSQFVEDEKRAEGTLQWQIWKTYLTTGGGLAPWVWVLITFGGYSIVLTARAWWLHVWSDEEENASCNATRSAVCRDDRLLFYLGVYVGLGALVCFIGTARSYFALKISVKSAKNLFSGLLHSILHAPLRWIDTVPPGRIMNRFIVDILIVDSQLGDDIQSTLSNAFDMVLAILAGSIVSPWLVIPAAFLCVICVSYGRTYLNAAREIRRLENVLKSSIFEHVRSSLSGLWTIRAEDKTAIYVTKVTEQIDRYARAYWQLWLFNCWLAFRMDVLGAIFAMVASVLVVSSPSVNASLAGFAISFALKMASSMSLTVRRYAGLELSMSSVERILEYTELPTEPIHSGDKAPPFWPSRGCVQVSNLSVSYAPNLPPALHDITFRVGPGERVGVVGRTGSGKSSLILALFRFLEANEGSIVIDGLDISMLELQQMRERLAIVPQDPAVFSGTVRTNLDPFRQHSDDELLGALRDVQWEDDLVSPTTSLTKQDEFLPSEESQILKDEDESSIPLMTIETPTDTQNPMSPCLVLDYPIAADGQNLSQGRRQLLCLARAIVQRPKLLVLDEATSGIDHLIDSKVQSSIRHISKMNSMSLLVVAHRLSTIVDFDRILVLSGGRVAEFGDPQELIQRPDGVFRAMMMEGSEKDSKTVQ